MELPEISVDTRIAGQTVSATLSLETAARWFRDLSERNAESRARDEDPSLRPCRSVRVCCPTCSAPIFFLTSVVRGFELRRACRACRSEFAVDL